MKIMKGIFVLAILGLMVLSACSKSDPMAQNKVTQEQQPVTKAPAAEDTLIPLDNVESAVDDTELDGLDSELEELDW
jgi:PBP1b-binding outer membrane lipoprotein LpoB